MSMKYLIENKSYFNETWRASEWSGDEDPYGCEPMSTLKRALQQIQSARLMPASTTGWRYRLVRLHDDGLREVVPEEELQSLGVVRP